LLASALVSEFANIYTNQKKAAFKLRINQIIQLNLVILISITIIVSEIKVN